MTLSAQHPVLPAHRPGRSARLCRWVVLLVACCARFAAAQDLARLAPSETLTYVQINQAAALRGDLEKEPLFRALMDTPARSDAQDSWKQLEVALGMPRREIFDRFFGRRVAFLAPANRDDGAVVSSVSEDDAKLAVTRLQLQRLGETPPLTIYRTQDGHGRVAFGGGLMLIGRAETGFFDSALQAAAGKSAPLSDEPTFRAWAQRMPRGGEAFLFHRQGKDEIHAATLRREDANLILDYAGDCPPARAVIEHVARASASDFGPAPPGALGAITINLFTSRVDPRLSRRVDRLLTPKSLEKDIIPRLSAPWLIYLGQAPGDGPTPGATSRQPIPCAAIAVKLADPTVAADLSAMLRSLTDAINVVAAARNAEPIITRSVGQGPESYDVADLSGPASRTFRHPEMAPLLHLTYGRVGKWFVLASQESFFLECRRSANENASSIAGAALDSLVQPRPQPVVTAVFDAPRVASQLNGLLDRIKAARPSRAAGPEWRTLLSVAKLLSNSKLAVVQAWREGDALRASVRISR